MSRLEKSGVNSYIQIHDPELNVEEIMQKIESRLKSRNISKEDIERISTIQFSPFQNLTERNFDPSYAANLFEKGISVPQFTNPKLWFLKGPLRWFLLKIVEFYSVMDKKFSENRVRAFFQVLHEIVLLRKQHNLLSNKLEEFYKEYIQMKFELSQKIHPVYSYYPLSLQMNFDSTPRSEIEFLLELICNAQPVVIYYPASIDFLHRFNARRISYQIVTPYEEDLHLLRRTVTEHVSTEEKIPAGHSVLFHANACLFSSAFWEGTLRSWKSSEKNTRFIIRINDGIVSRLSPFRDNLPMKVNTNELPNYLRNLGFCNVNIYEKDQAGWIYVCFMNASS